MRRTITYAIVFLKFLLLSPAVVNILFCFKRTGSNLTLCSLLFNTTWVAFYVTRLLSFPGVSPGRQAGL